ncbi:MAG: hypothetical protein Q7S74_04715 [Nanoarchaeota archaeon]|nr:hypothetical protein [Nanoarchaeota archaeon]
METISTKRNFLLIGLVVLVGAIWIGLYAWAKNTAQATPVLRWILIVLFIIIGIFAITQLWKLKKR